ncbi:hypothetical protein CY34DRAFT_16041 [Suillus luteus UH-Slu-Lm8-n1]|uniref:Uncharacterized protein n=1 Tax=Suillus luteus UH-Slu-Lm8-n1 TaxID=930992 RepID=A0A0D0AYN0_9AGAM|nr:hypothetical protein CY34DRAFT_16041 [Suillus luteus UH-Slu-Lm8-n1]
MPSEDPFADPGRRGPSHHLYPPQQPADISSPIVDEYALPPAEPVAVPLSAMHEVMLTNSVRRVTSGYTSSDGAGTGYFQNRDIPIETNEHLPLITRPGRSPTPPIVTAFSQPSPSIQSYQNAPLSTPRPYTHQSLLKAKTQRPNTNAKTLPTTPFTALIPMMDICE